MPVTSSRSLPRLGILACDRVWEPLRSRHGDYAALYAGLLRETGAAFQLVEFAVFEGDFPAQPTDCDAWLISGSRASVFEGHAWIADAMEFVRAAHAAQVPQLGVCFGHQLLAQALGGRTERAACGWGLGNIELSVRPGAGVPLPPRLRLYMAHQDQVVALPPDAECLASTTHCENAMFRLGRYVLGVQPHPEFSGELMQDVALDKNLALSPATREAALASLRHPADSSLMAPWLVDFLGLGGKAARAGAGS